MTHDSSNLDHYCMSYMSKELQNGHVFYLYTKSNLIIYLYIKLTTQKKYDIFGVHSHIGLSGDVIRSSEKAWAFRG